LHHLNNPIIFASAMWNSAACGSRPRQLYLQLLRAERTASCGT